MRKKNKPYLERRMKELIDSVKPNTGFTVLPWGDIPNKPDMFCLNLNTKAPFLMVSVGKTKGGKFFLGFPALETHNPIGNEYSIVCFDDLETLLQQAKDRTIRFLSLTGRNPVINFTELEKVINQFGGK